ncbi:MAG TPA: helix-turn-helix domain-containing protein [Devosiaceae bacterium]|jgi:transcriptional regulator with XRE-family HTH domain
MDTLGSRIKAARKAAGLTQQQVAEHFGISRVNVTQWESDTTRPDGYRLPDLAGLLGLEEAWLRDGAGPAPDLTAAPAGGPRPKVSIIPGSQLVSAQKMPVYAAAMGGEGHIIVSFDQIDEIKRPAELENVRGGYGLLIKGDSMVPALWEGDMALVNPHLPPARQRNVILYHTPPDGGEIEAIVKQLNGWTEREWHLQQWNPNREFKEFRQEWPVCHRVVGKYDGR